MHISDTLKKMSNKLLKVKVNVCFYQCSSITTNYLWGKVYKIDQHYQYKNEEINLFQKKIKISLIVQIFKWSLGLPYKWIYEYKDVHNVTWVKIPG